MNVYILPRCLDICIKMHTFLYLSLYSFEDWIWKMNQIRSPSRHFRKNSPFNGQQTPFIIVKYEQSNIIKEVQRAFRRKFYPKARRKVPCILAFTRTFKEETTFRPQAPACRQSKRAIAVQHRNCENLFWTKSEMPCKASSKSAWLELRSNLENFEEKSKMEGLQATPDAMSEPGI